MDVQTGLHSNKIGKFRLPTIQELKSIVDYTKCNPATNLGGIKSDGYWSSSPCVSGSSLAWVVGFYGGRGYNGNKSSSFYVRCVRTLNDGSLEWAKEDAPKPLSWKEAMDYAEALNIEPKKTIVLETWLISSILGGYMAIEATREYCEELGNKVKLLSTREIEL